MRKPFLNIPIHIVDEFWAIYLSVCDTMGIDPNRGRLKTRKREIVLTRQISMYMMFQNTTAGPTDIGSFFFQDHSNALHARDMIDDLLDAKDSFVCDCYNHSVKRYRENPPNFIERQFDFVLHAASTLI